MSSRQVKKLYCKYFSVNTDGTAICLVGEHPTRKLELSGQVEWSAEEFASILADVARDNPELLRAALQAQEAERIAEIVWIKIRNEE